MSISSGTIHCDGCDFETSEMHRPIKLIYHLKSGEIVESGRTSGWCYDCDKYVEIEDVDFQQIRTVWSNKRKQLEALQAEMKELSKGILGFMKNKERKREVRNEIRYAGFALDRYEKQLMIAEDRQAKPRCLYCWGENTEKITFNNEGISDFLHKCGGKLHLSYDKDAPRFHFTPEEIHLDQEGNQLTELY